MIPSERHLGDRESPRHDALPSRGATVIARRDLLLSAGFLLAWVGLVVRVLLPLARVRHFGIDEVQVAYNAALLGYHHLPAWVDFRAPFIVVLSWIAAGMTASWPTLLAMRAPFFALFLLVLVLVAAAAPRVRGLPARSAVLLAFTLVEPFWRHGYEIRHDVLMLAASLGLFALTQRAARRGLGAPGLLAAGALAVGMQLNSMKSFVVWVPGVALLLVVLAARGGVRRPVRGLALLTAGGLGALLLSVIVLASAGIAQAFFAQLFDFAGSAGSVRRLPLAGRLSGLLLELPHLTLLAAGSLAASLVGVARRQSSPPALLTGGWLLLELLALQLNPTPFGYNLIHLIPFLFLAAVDGFVRLWQARPRARAVLAGGAVLATLGAFAGSWPGDSIARVGGAPQRAHIEVVESLTGRDDPFLDGAGLVISRRPPGADWLQHSLNLRAYRRGEITKFRQLLARDPPPVLLYNYRWLGLDPEDLALVRERYVAIAPAIFALGGRAEAASGTFPIFRAGRYRLSCSAPQGCACDGTALSATGVVRLAVGPHAWGGGALSWVWVGPHLDAPPAPPPLLPNGYLFVTD